MITGQHVVSTAKLRILMSLLQHAKNVYYAIIKTNDIHMQKNAIKRIMNLFIEVAQTPEPSGMPNLKEACRDDLDDLTHDEIDEKENSDIFWLRRYAHIRAKYYFEKMKDLKLSHDQINEFE